MYKFIREEEYAKSYGEEDEDLAKYNLHWFMPMGFISHAARSKTKQDLRDKFSSLGIKAKVTLRESWVSIVFNSEEDEALFIVAFGLANADRI